MEPSQRNPGNTRKVRTNVPVKDKMNAVLRVLAGESVQTVAQSIDVSSRRVTEWQQHFLQGAEASLMAAASKPRPKDPNQKNNKPIIVLQWLSLVLVLFIVVFFLVRLLDHAAPQ